MSSQESQWKRRGIKNASMPIYLKLLEQQGGVCAICGTPPRTRKLALDHDHKTGQIRGLLCYHCNYGLRWFEWFNKTPDRLQKAVEYMNRTPSEPVVDSTETPKTPPRPTVAARRIEALAAIQRVVESMPEMPIKLVVEQVAKEMELSPITIQRYLKSKV